MFTVTSIFLVICTFKNVCFHCNPVNKVIHSNGMRRQQVCVLQMQVIVWCCLDLQVIYFHGLNSKWLHSGKEKHKYIGVDDYINNRGYLGSKYWTVCKKHQKIYFSWDMSCMNHKSYIKNFCTSFEIAWT